MSSSRSVLHLRLLASRAYIEARQAVKDVNAAQEVLIDIFERIENFFERLETYTEVRPNEAMTDIIVKIMVEVLNVFAIATKEIKQGRTSELPIHVLRIYVAKCWPEKYLKKVLGKTEIEDALKRLDKLTQDELRMAMAQLLTLTHGVDYKVTRIDDGVKCVDGKVMRIDDELEVVGGKVRDIDDKVTVAHEGTQYVMPITHAFVNVYAARWKGNKSNRATYGKQRQRSDEFVVQ